MPGRSDHYLQALLQRPTFDRRGCRQTNGGQTVVISGGDCTISFWDVLSEKEQRKLKLYDKRQEPRLVWRLPGGIHGLKITPDGKHLLTANANGTVYIFKMPAGPEVKPEAVTPSPAKTEGSLDHLDAAKIPASERFDWQPKELVAVVGEHRQRHWSNVFSVAVSPDGKSVASAGNGRHVRVWDAQTMQLRAWLETEDNVVNSVAFTRDGKTLIGVGDGAIWLWRLEDNQWTKRERIADLSSGRLVLSPDGKRGALYHSRQTLTVVDIAADGRPNKRFTIHVPPGVHSAAFLPDGKLAVGDTDGQLRVWEVDGPEAKALPPIRVADPKMYVDVLAAPTGKRMVVYGGHGRLLLWEWDGKEHKECGQIAANAFGTAAFSADGKLLLVGGQSGGLWDVSGPKPVLKGSLRQTKIPIGTFYRALAFAPDGKTVYSGDEAGKVQAWDLTGPEPKERLPVEGTYGGMSKIVFSADGKTLAGTDTNAIWVWDLTGPQPRERARLPHIPSLAAQLALSPNGKTLASVNSGDLTIWDTTDELPIERDKISLAKGTLRVLRFSPDGKTLAVADEQDKVGVLRLFDMTGPKAVLRTTLKHPESTELVCATFSQDGKTVAIGYHMGPVRLWDLSGKEPKVAHTIECQSSSVAFSPNARMLLCGPGRVYDLSDTGPKERTTLQGHEVEAQVAFAHDGQNLVTCSQRFGIVALWDILAERELRQLKFKSEFQKPRWSMQLAGPIHDLAIAPDGRYAATANANGTVYILRLPAREK